MIRALFAAALLLNGGVPAMPVANALPVDAGQSQHDGHNMSDMLDMAMGSDSAGKPSTDCCDDGSMDCQCGCVVSQPGAPYFFTATQVRDGTPELGVVVVSSHISSSITTPFRPPA